MSETKAETVDLRDHPDWQTGDFTLITADGWRFKVWSHHLLTARYGQPDTYPIVQADK